jgi:hypothetical protein
MALFQRKSPPPNSTVGSTQKTVGATRRLLNFFWPASEAGELRFGGGWMAINRSKTDGFNAFPEEIQIVLAEFLSTLRG